MGAGIDAIQAAADIGIRADNAINTLADQAGFAESYMCASNAIVNLRERRSLHRNADGSSYRDDIDRNYRSR